ncbi:MAG: hypothetical protein KME27_13940 [Lyngbya sp. HA4199-MV5]|nr:hypothetical protein [Lyngbya sp. HA4199-MV5]
MPLLDEKLAQQREQSERDRQPLLQRAFDPPFWLKNPSMCSIAYVAFDILVVMAMAQRLRLAN